ncbi:MAG: hypothetical protein HS130_07710 [Deltaproteobacteria bacterium]|nr:hypothetical protein [Deltaproteobacteria bacterium]MCL4873103.1 hypothetical protein [bacterium]
MTADQLDIFQQGLSDEEYRVWEIIEAHRGRENAIKADALAWKVGLDGVRVREIVSHLIREHGKLIGSSTGNPPGFYVITDREELERQIRSLRHRGIMCLVRAAALSKSSIEEIFRQGRLDIDGM